MPRKPRTESDTTSELWQWDYEREAERAAAAQKKRKRRRRWSLGLFGTALVLGGSYVGAAYALAGSVPANTKISGVEVGGLAKADAAAVVRSELSKRLAGTRKLVVAGAATDETLTLDPNDISLEVDAEKTLNQLVGFSLHPRNIWAHLAGSVQRDVDLRYDLDAATQALDAAAKRIDRDAADASARFDTAAEKFVVQEAQAGVKVDVAASAEQLGQHWLDDAENYTLVAEVTQPQFSTQAVQDFVDSAVNPLLASTVSVSVRLSPVQLLAKQLGPMLRVTTANGSIAVEVDEEKLAQTVNAEAESKGYLNPPTDAQITIVNHSRVQIVPEKVGEGIDAAQVAEDLISLPQRDDLNDRTIVANVEERKAAFTSADAQKLGVKEVVSEIRTPLIGGTERNQNLTTGSGYVSNRVIKPGERFDLAQSLGDITYERGFREAGVSLNGFGSLGMGGGLSQLATNTFNVGYRAGMIDVQHRPHSMYYERYPRVLESTIAVGSINVVWENNTPYGAVIDSWIEGNELVTKLWSTKYWDVEVWIGPKTDIVPATVKYNPNPDCAPTAPGGAGFTATAGRKVSLNGEVKEDSKLTHRYAPHNGAKCEP